MCVRGRCKEVGDDDSPMPSPHTIAPRRRRDKVVFLPVRGASCKRSTDCPGPTICRKGRCWSVDSVDSVTPGAHRGTASRGKRRRFGDQGSLEAGGSFMFSFERNNFDGLDGHFETYSLQAGLYLGYFVTRFFALGFYVGLPYRESRFVTEEDYNAYTVRDLGLSVVFAPGIAGRFGKRAAFYADLLLGIGHIRSLSTDADGSEVRTQVVSGLVGAEAGVKFLATRHLLVRIGLRPTYWFGSAEVKNDYGDTAEADFDGLRVELVVGFSYYQ